MPVCARSSQLWSSPLSPLHLLQQCSTSRDVNQLHAHLITTGLIRNASVTTRIVLSLASSRHPNLVEFARCLFKSCHADRRNVRDPFLWNAVIKSYSHGDDDPEQAFVLLCWMMDNGVCLDKYSMSLVIKACCKMRMLKEGMQIHGVLMKWGDGLNSVLENCLIALYARCGCVGHARQVFDRMHDRDSISYNCLIDGYGKCGMMESAGKLFEEMPNEVKNLISWNSVISGYAQTEAGLRVAWEFFEKMPERDVVTWNIMLDGFLKCRKLEAARALFDRMPRRDVVSWTNMIDGYSKLGMVSAARHLFDVMPERNVIAWNSMIGGYVQNGFHQEALCVFQDMQANDGLYPDETSFLSILSAIAQLGHLHEGVATHQCIKELKYPLDGKIGVALVDMYAKCGNIDKAIRVFEDVKAKSVDHWNAMIGGLAIHGLGEAAFELFMEMVRQSVRPDYITFISVLSACSHSGLLKEGIISFELMTKIYRIEPKHQHYGCMLDILGRAGRIEEAREIINTMPVDPSEVVWRTLLAACRNHDNLAIGVPAAAQLIDSNSQNSSSYVLLSNIYASFGLWSEAKRLRALMRDRDLKKLPGCSWIELDGVTHEFFSNHKSQLGLDIDSELKSFSTPS